MCGFQKYLKWSWHFNSVSSEVLEELCVSGTAVAQQASLVCCLCGKIILSLWRKYLCPLPRAGFGWQNVRGMVHAISCCFASFSVPAAKKWLLLLQTVIRDGSVWWFQLNDHEHVKKVLLSNQKELWEGNASFPQHIWSCYHSMSSNKDNAWRASCTWRINSPGISDPNIPVLCFLQCFLCQWVGHAGWTCNLAFQCQFFDNQKSIHFKTDI